MVRLVEANTVVNLYIYITCKRYAMHDIYIYIPLSIEQFLLPRD